MTSSEAKHVCSDVAVFFLPLRATASLALLLEARGGQPPSVSQHDLFCISISSREGRALLLHFPSLGLSSAGNLLSFVCLMGIISSKNLIRIFSRVQPGSEGIKYDSEGVLPKAWQRRDDGP